MDRSRASEERARRRLDVYQAKKEAFMNRKRGRGSGPIQPPPHIPGMGTEAPRRASGSQSRGITSDAPDWLREERAPAPSRASHGESRSIDRRGGERRPERLPVASKKSVESSKIEYPLRPRPSRRHSEREARWEAKKERFEAATHKTPKPTPEPTPDWLRGSQLPPSEPPRVAAAKYSPIAAPEMTEPPARPSRRGPGVASGRARRLPPGGSSQITFG